MNELSLKALRSFSGVGPIPLWHQSTALLIVDMQGSCCNADGFTMRRLRERKLELAAEQYANQLKGVIPRLATLLQRMRNNGQFVIHTCVESIPGRQPGGQARAGRWVQPGTAEAQFVPELQPAQGEFVLRKSSSGVFASTNLDFLLRRLQVTSLIVGGVVTNGCVEHAITHAHDFGYACVLVADGSAALTDEIHQNALERLDHRRAHVIATDTLLGMDGVEGSHSA